MKAPVAWTIGGSDSSGGSGIQADLETFRSFAVHGANIVTNVTAQTASELLAVTPVPLPAIEAQITALEKQFPAQAIKIGMLANSECARLVSQCLKRSQSPVILDPVLATGGDHSLSDSSLPETLRRQMVRLSTVFTPNLKEAELLCERPIRNADEMESAARLLLSEGAASILIKGGHSNDPQTIRHCWRSGGQTLWIAKPRIATSRLRGTGCTLSSAIASGLALGLDLLDAIILAEVFVTRSVRASRKINSEISFLNRPLVAESDFTPEDLPGLCDEKEASSLVFPSLSPGDLGFYPLVDSAEKAKQLMRWGVKTIQLRIKNLKGSELFSEIQRTVDFSKQFDVQLFINDYWDLAIQAGAFGVHLGQSDLSKTALSQISQAGLKLGISTHGYAELARANSIRPSYIAIGPVFSTASKKVETSPLGLRRFSCLRRLVVCPVVAIGGVTLDTSSSVIANGADSIALINDLTNIPYLEGRVMEWMNRFTPSAKV